VSDELDKLLAASGDLESVARGLETVDDAVSSRVVADPEKVEQGLAQLVLTLIELLRQLMERQALRRIDAGRLPEEKVERLDHAFMELDRAMTELREHFGLDEEDLNLHLGPLGRLL
jgi:hypothetical protein